MTASDSRSWVCTVCGYVHEGPAPPDECPVCGAGADAFEKQTADPPVAAAAAGEAPRRIVIVGGGIAGVAAAEAARKTAPEADITLVAAEGLPYYRISLTRWLAGETGEKDLPLHPEAWYEERGIRRVYTEATALDTERGVLARADGDTLAFDRLVLACGARAFVPPIPGADGPRVHTLRTREDAGRILDAARSGARCAVVGGGILGLEIAGALARRGLEVSLLEGHDFLMPRQLPEPGARIMATFVRNLGIDLRSGSPPAAIEAGGASTVVRLESGTRVAADLVVLATGVRSEVALARAAGIEVATGAVVDDRLCTSRTGIHAAGDIAEHRGILYGNWSAAQVQGAVAGINAAGGAASFPGLPRTHTLKVLGLGLVSIGRFSPEGPEDRVVEESSGSDYRRFLIHEGRLAGAVLLGDTRLGARAATAVEEGADADAWLRENRAES